ncbi:MAG: hypothetical protein Q4D89_05320 [Arachnia propionica]|uniref:hypothetical protein n=1 Tax=Arachnia propionica TaxID=1750 RepID=UPI00270558CF|nr:hypothetical protein [Arachnia propionica]
MATPLHGGATSAIHETFHHTQCQSGISWAAREVSARDSREITRRLELQTTCSVSRQALTLGIGLTEADHEHLMHPPGRSDSETHGSHESCTYWAGWGFHVTTMQGCNTWIIPSHMVD